MQNQSGDAEQGSAPNPVVQTVVAILSWIEQIKVGESTIALPDGKTTAELAIAPLSELISFLKRLCASSRSVFWRSLPESIESDPGIFQSRRVVFEWLEDLLGQLMGR